LIRSYRILFCMQRKNTMKESTIKHLVFILFVVFLIACQDEEPPDTRPIKEKLSDLSGVEVTEIDPPHGHVYAFRLDITQPLDHNNPGSPTFTQEVYLHHADESSPMVFGPSGYGVSERSNQELAGMLKCNLITVTHRFFTDSEPSPGDWDWEFLTIEQAAADHHHIVDLLDDIYSEVWISSGASKSGQAVLFHKRFYPDDVEATVAYVAPIVFGTKDPRFTAHLNSLGDEECRNKLEQYERNMLIERDSIIPLFERWYQDNGLVLSLDVNEAYEYAVMEYHFAFWQYHRKDCSTIPGDEATYQEMFNHFEEVMWLPYFSDYYLYYYEPYVYQALTETGYPVYITEHIDDLLLYVTDPGAEFFLVSDIDPVYDDTKIKDINEWLQSYGDNIIYIYGEIDPWTAAMFELTGETNAIRIIQPGADHRVKIADLDEKDLVIETLEEWLGIDINF